MNRKLKAAIILRCGTVAKAARECGMREDRLSRIIHNRVKPRPDEKRALAWRLQKPLGELFGNEKTS